ncbi:MAG: glycoside hydrolase family 2 TIM barrel-domain containing protein, partial [bacterium]
SVNAAGDAAGASAEAELVLPNGDSGAVLIGVKGKPGRVLKLAFPKGTAPKLWTPESPFIYDLKIKLRAGKAGGAAIDSVASYAGMRKVSVAKDAGGVTRIFLNNKPLFMYGVLDQGFWPDGIYTAPTDAALRFDIEATKQLGFNMTRKHVKVEPARWYYWCDKLGLLVWQDMPSGDDNMNPGRELQRGKDSADNYNIELKHLIDNLYNSPSIVVWVPFNEGWGQFDTARVADWVKKRDPSRLVDNSSGWTDMKIGDISDIHRYPEPDAPPVEETRAAVVGEFGGLGFTVEGHNWREGMERIGGEKPGGRNWGYRQFQGSEQLWNQYRSLDMALSRLIRLKGLSAAVYTQITDVEMEVNGLISYDREIFKFEPERMAAENNMLYGAIAAGVGEALRTVIPSADIEKTIWRFTTKKPAGDWARPDFDDGNWRKGAGGFGGVSVNGRNVGTIWSAKQIWLRREFDIPDTSCSEPMLSVFNSAPAEIFINGVLAATAAGAVNSYVLLPVEPAAAAAIVKGKNVIAASSGSDASGQFIDIGLSVVCKK